MARLHLPKTLRRAAWPCALALLLAAQAGCQSDPAPAPPQPRDAQDATHGANSPDNAIFRDDRGRELTVDELKRYAAKLETTSPPWEMGVSRQARILYTQGQQAGGQQQYKEAVDTFIQSSLAARHWPPPVYGAAWAYLLQGDQEKALSAYEHTDELEPRGYLATKIAIDTIKREMDGVLPGGAYMRLELKLANGSREEKIAFLKEILKEFKEFPAAWKELASLAPDDSEAMTAIETGLSFNPDPETKAALLVHKAIILERRGLRDEAIRILVNVALDPTTTMTGERLAKTTLLDLAQ